MKNELSNLPEHIAIIMDGNGRWAKKRFLNVSAGHYAGAQTLKKLSQDADALGLKYLTVYAFSTENWSRQPAEVTGLMNLIRRFVKEYINDAEKKNLRIRVIGDISKFDQDIRDMIAELEEKTGGKTGLTVILALNYGGRDEITRAAKKICRDAQDGKLANADLTETIFSEYLDTRDYPEPALIIRTAGEKRLSNFLLWQAAYAELYFDDCLWPDYNISRLETAIEDFSDRQRRFGGR